MSCLLHHTLVLFFLSTTISSLETDYFWRDYTGIIPEDAIIAGRDVNGHPVYIGQAYIRNLGLFPAQITTGAKTIHAAIYGAKSANDNIKILCGRQEDFSWFRSNSSTLHLDLVNKRPVFGGHLDDGGKLYIGKISHEGGDQIGKVDAMYVGDAGFWFVNKRTQEQGAKSYEVLIYQKKKGSMDERIF